MPLPDTDDLPEWISDPIGRDALSTIRKSDRVLLDRTANGMLIVLKGKPKRFPWLTIPMLVISVVTIPAVVILHNQGADSAIGLRSTTMAKLLAVASLSIVFSLAGMLLHSVLPPEGDATIETWPGGLKVDCRFVGTRRTAQFTADDIRIADTEDGLTVFPTPSTYFFLARSLKRPIAAAVLEVALRVARAQPAPTQSP